MPWLYQRSGRRLVVGAIVIVSNSDSGQPGLTRYAATGKSLRPRAACSGESLSGKPE